MADDKLIRVTCEGAGLVPIEQMTVLQGNLKTLDQDARDRLRKSILTHGITFPFHIWRQKDLCYILDATQRYHVLHDLIREGFHVPPLPVAWIHAKDKREAAMKLLAAASQYGQVTNEGLRNFVNTFDLVPRKVVEIHRMPGVDMSAWLKQVEQISKQITIKGGGGDPSNTKSKTQAEDLQRFLNNDARHLILLYKLDIYDHVVARFDQLKAHYGCENISEAVLKAVEEILNASAKNRRGRK